MHRIRVGPAFIELEIELTLLTVTITIRLSAFWATEQVWEFPAKCVRNLL
jgi:hypothetical protein